MRRLLALLAAAFAAHGCLYETESKIPGLDLPQERSGPDRVAPALTTITKLAGPESVLYDREQDVYFISNINGGLLTRDGNGFITRVRADKMTVELKWIDGLDAPKGMAIAGGSLYVSDITGVRKFDRRSGAPQGVIALPGATLINDLTTDGQAVYASDTGVKPSSGITFAPTGTDAIWKIEHDRATKIASGTQLNQPNGIDWFDGKLWVASFRGNELYRLDGSERADIEKVPRGQLDGVVHLADGTRLVTSWIGKSVYRGDAKGNFVAILRGIAAPADIGYDTKRQRLLVPNSPMNEVTIHSVR